MCTSVSIETWGTDSEDENRSGSIHWLSEPNEVAEVREQFAFADRISRRSVGHRGPVDGCCDEATIGATYIRFGTRFAFWVQFYGWRVACALGAGAATYVPSPVRAMADR